MKCYKCLYFLGFIVSAECWANDAGSISRQAEQDIPIQPQTVNLPKLEQTAVSTDNTPIEVKHIQLNGRTLVGLEEIQPTLDKHIGTTTTFGGLQQLARQVTNIYHQAGYPLAQVVIPPQRIENGVVVLQVIEGKIASVNVQNQSRLSDKVAENYLTRAIQPNAPLKQADSERALLLIKDLAGTEGVNYRLAGEEQGTNLVVDLDKAPLVDGFVQVDNYGSKSTGKVRTRAGINLNSPFGYGERISAQGMTSLKGVDYARLSADLPVGYDGLMVSAGVGHTRYDLGGAFKDLEATGTADTVDVGIRYPALRSNNSSVWINVGAEHRKLKDEIGATNTTTHKTLKAIQLGLSGYHQDRLGASGYTQWSLNNTLGNLDIKSADARAIDAVSAKTQGNYHKITGNLGRTQYFTPKFSLYTGVNGQWANKNLDSAEQFSLGGADSVAAYHSNDVSTDLAAVGQIEARYALNSAITLGAFYDVGRAKLQAKPYTDTRNFVNLYGGGIGLYTQYKDFSLQSKIAWQGSDETFSDNKDPRWWLKVGYQF